MAEKIRGIFAPHIVPLDDRSRINEPELRRYVDWLIEKGIDGLYPNGSTGEFTSALRPRNGGGSSRSSASRRPAGFPCWRAPPRPT
jgi:hypothetical protein